MACSSRGLNFKIRGGQFAPEWVGQFEPGTGGHLNRNRVVSLSGISISISDAGKMLRNTYLIVMASLSIAIFSITEGLFGSLANSSTGKPTGGKDHNEQNESGTGNQDENDTDDDNSTK